MGRQFRLLCHDRAIYIDHRPTANTLVRQNPTQQVRCQRLPNEDRDPKPHSNVTQRQGAQIAPVTACKNASPSECPSKPRDDGIHSAQPKSRPSTRRRISYPDQSETPSEQTSLTVLKACQQQLPQSGLQCHSRLLNAACNRNITVVHLWNIALPNQPKLNGRSSDAVDPSSIPAKHRSQLIRFKTLWYASSSLSRSLVPVLST